MPQTARITDCWLWPERAGVRWWTPAATGWLDLAAPGTTDLTANIAALRDQFQHEPLGAVLAPELAHMLADCLGKRPAACACGCAPICRFPGSGFPSST